MGDAERLRVIKIGADDTLSEMMIRDYPGMTEDTVGKDNLIEVVRPRGLLSLSTLVNCQISFLVDESFLHKPLPLNKVASRLYGFPEHPHPILGDAWLLAEVYADDGMREFASLPGGITEESFRRYLDTGSI